MMEEFEALPIDRGFISELHVAANKTFSLDVMSGPFDTGGGEVCRVYELTFRGLRGFRFDVRANPWLEIVSHGSLIGSEMLEEHKVMGGSDNDSLSHFQIVCDEGTLDIIAKEFTHAVKEEMAFVRNPQVE